MIYSYAPLAQYSAQLLPNRKEGNIAPDPSQITIGYGGEMRIKTEALPFSLERT
jgi:hypothetical protein